MVSERHTRGSQEEAFTHWAGRIFEWSAVAADPSANAANYAQDRIAAERLEEMAKIPVDALLQDGYSPGQVTIALAHGAYLTVAEMVRQYVPEGP